MAVAVTPAVSAAPIPACVDLEYAEASPALIKLGQMLFYDPVLSGGQEVACATCHHPRHGTSDGVSLGIGDGGVGLGPSRRADPENPPEQRIPRNSTALFNLGAKQFSVMFADGRLEGSATRPHGLRTPIGQSFLSAGLTPLEAQTMFPVLSPDEMAGHYNESDVSIAVRRGMLAGEGGAWDLLQGRIAAIPAYQSLFADAFGPQEPVSFTGVAHALAAFIAFEWRADDSGFDRHICAGAPLPPDAARGMALFYGKAGCADCHAGRLQTDHDFHAIAMPQIGPGKAERFEDHARDPGRMRVTGQAEDAYRFRTPSLRNIARSAPYGHSGAYATLEGIINHHLDPEQALARYDRSQAILTPFPGLDDFRILDDQAEMSAIAAANQLPVQSLSDAEVADIVAFLHALTDHHANDGRLGVPSAVPSGLTVP